MKTPVIALQASMGQAVLERLSELTSLEGLLESYDGVCEGFVAGQAVASAVSELFYDGLGVVYNDVDVFLLSDAFERSAGQVLTTLEHDTVELSVHYRQLTLSLTTVYEVMRTRRRGMLNEVLCRPAVEFEKYPTQAALLFLQSFDLNCVQVGVRLSDKQLVWTPAFEQFLATREMLVMNIKTPLHTAIRWFRKKDELEGVFGHDDRTMELLAAMSMRIEAKLPQAGAGYRRELQAQSLFAEGYAAKARAVEDELSRYFSLQAGQTELDQLTLYTLKPTFEPRPELLDERVWHPGLPTYARAVQGHYRRHICEALIAALPLAEDRRFSLSNSCAMLEGEGFAKALRNLKDIAKLDRLVEQHPNIVWLTRRLDTAQQLVLVDTLTKLSGVHGRWVWGLFETMESGHTETLSRLSGTELAAELERLCVELIASVKALALEYPPLAPLLSELELDGYTVRELLTFEELAEEGERQHHCVAGYYRSVLEGKCRIIQLRKGPAKTSVTMELRPWGNGWRCGQLHGLLNRAATDDEHKTAKRYVELVNVSVGLRPLPAPIAPVMLLQNAHPGFVAKMAKALAGADDERKPAQSWKMRIFTTIARARGLPQGFRERRELLSHVDMLGSFELVKALVVALRARMRARLQKLSDAEILKAYAPLIPALATSTQDPFDDDLPF